MTSRQHRQPWAGEYLGEAVVYIPLTRGHVAVVDVDIWPRIAREHGSTWTAYDNGRDYLNARHDYKTPTGYRALTLARAVLMPEEGDEVRAKNGDALDCRLSNLTTAPRRGHKMRSRRHMADKEAA